MPKVLAIFISLSGLIGSVNSFAQANQTLSNLTGPTAINASLLVDTDNAYDLGSSTKALANVYSGNLIGRPGWDLNIKAPNTLTGDGFSTVIFGGTTSQTGAANGGSVVLQAGSVGAIGAGGNGGSVYIQAGGGNSTAGNIYLSPGSQQENSARGYILATAHLEFTSDAPSLGSCGTSPTMVGNDIVGRINVGSGTSSCAVNFSQAWSNTPMCFVSNQTARVALRIVPTTTTLTISAAANFAASTVLDYHCVGFQ